MDKQSLEQTLRKSRELQQRYAKFLQQKQESDRQFAQTQARVDRTLARLAQTKQTIKQIDNLYDRYTQAFDNMISAAVSQLQKSRLLEAADPDFVPVHADPAAIAKILKSKRKVMFMTGAGVSAASGIPTFRDADGYWTKKKQQNITPQEFLTMRKYEKQPQEIWGWLDDFYSTKQKCKANLGHTSIDAICNKMLKNKAEACIITQNIDNFHNEAASNPKYPIFQVHGNITKLRCDACSNLKPSMQSYPYTAHRSAILNHSPVFCPTCARPLRPHIMFFDQFYTQKFHHCQSVSAYIKEADLLFVIGTALQTGLARSTVESCLENGVDIVEINLECTLRHKGVKWMQGKSDEILNRINKQFL